MKPRHLALMLFINIIWALNTVALKESVTAVPPLLAVGLRFLMVVPICLPWMRWVPGRMPLLIGTGLVAGAGSFGIGAIGFHLADNVSAIAIAGQLGVPFSLILAILVFGERIRWKRTLGILLAFLGVAVLAFDPHIVDERWALFFAILGSLLWAIGNLGYRKLTGVHVLNLYGWVALVSVPPLFLASLAFEPGAVAGLGGITLASIGWITYSALFASLIGHVGMAWLLQRYPVSTITPLTLPTPLLSVILALFVYPTPITLQLVAGGLLTLVGVAIIALRTAQKREDAA
ncbi:DMT family transporter [Sandaracinobacteroides saxicola]|uniref:EamA family transporter n=1 Tax=Sandaracinobacteroides saxicola TaxID=2759707 RepID=A0A7G5IJJ1_9SPHN|nr:EamA family transporter [Sandaracinobacteroides saxicola]QMW23533.1 EamA family transporter [Sandaracinobacteroides saxicola]